MKRNIKVLSGKTYKLWNEESGLKYWYRHPERHYIEQIQKKYNNFNVEENIKRFFQEDEIKNVVDIGAGKYGGFLYFYKKGKNRYIVDLLADLFKNGDQKVAKLADDIIPISCDFADMPFGKDTIDIMFSQESLDHCKSEEHFYQCIDKIVEVLKPGGLLFYEWLARKELKDSHIILRDCSEIIKDFSALKVIKNTRIKKRCYLIFQK